MTPNREGFVKKWTVLMTCGPFACEDHRDKHLLADLDALLSAERERCAQQAELLVGRARIIYTSKNAYVYMAYDNGIKAAAAAIRAMAVTV